MNESVNNDKICPDCNTIMDYNFITKYLNKITLKSEWKKYYKCPNCGRILYVRIKG